ncbi:uncharacterized protein GGS25DRAFT_484292 [Hypoxylon fragiforme]|uniref:uncharacterized protein n=1 Tax=Hypoxylon fragiforme TaxID=63214 RepID=UPI0020C60DE2|nr:uncharacterized protein GGS25DRAFT_484292 [Hypoxylon fragiforme]KAI2609347.1 hypothetical protein GGS25DRAFT_484292 [Hypoxylon fragiforme]
MIVCSRDAGVSIFSLFCVCVAEKKHCKASLVVCNLLLFLVPFLSSVWSFVNSLDAVFPLSVSFTEGVLYGRPRVF